MNKKLFPIVKICAEPGFDVHSIRDAGYETLYALFSGFETEDEESFLGWNGINEKHPHEVLENIVLVKEESMFVEYAQYITLIGNDFLVEKKVKRIVYPNGQ